MKLLIFLASIAVAEYCPLGFVAYSNGEFCCGRDYDSLINPITYESTSCSNDHQCPCGGVDGNYSTDVCSGVNTSNPDRICEQWACPVDHPFAYTFGKRCCESDPGGYDATSCENNNFVDCPGDAIRFGTPMFGACKDFPSASDQDPQRNTITISSNQITTNTENINTASTSDLSTGAIIGIVVGSVVFIAAISGGIYYKNFRKGTTSKPSQENFL